MMATGYVHNMLDNKQTFEQFALSCARAFGATILMRDDPLDAPIPERFEPSDYHVKERKKAEAELERLSAMSAGERRQWATNAIREDIAHWRECVSEESEKLSRCRAMLERVQGWTAPTKDHQEFKKFMVEQLESSMRGGVDFYQEEIDKLEKTSPAMYAAERMANLRRDIDYHAKGHTEEVERTENRNRWIAELRAALEPSKKNRSRTEGK